MAAKMVTIVGDVTGPQQRHHPKNIPSSCREDQRRFTEGKIVSKYCNKSKILEVGEGVHPPLLYHSAVMNLHVRPRVQNLTKLEPFILYDY